MLLRISNERNIACSGAQSKIQPGGFPFLNKRTRQYIRRHIIILLKNK